MHNRDGGERDKIALDKKYLKNIVRHDGWMFAEIIRGVE